MAHRDKNTQQYRVWLRKDTIKAVKAMAIILEKDWNVVLDDVTLAGVAYLNAVGKLELSSWSGAIKLPELNADLGLRIIRGDLPKPGEET